MGIHGSVDSDHYSGMGDRSIDRVRDKTNTGEHSSASVSGDCGGILHPTGICRNERHDGGSDKRKGHNIRALLGFLLGTGAGFVLALLMKLSGLVEKMLFPYLMLIQLIPVLGLAPIILSITGDINKSRIIIAAILSFYPVATNTLAGFKSVPQEKYDLMYTYAAKKPTIYAKVLIPTAIPYFFTGTKIAAPMAITASILVDTLQGDGGLGCMLSQSLKHAMSIYVFWLIVFFSAFIGIFSGCLMGWIENLVSPEKRGLRKAKRDAKKGVN